MIDFVNKYKEPIIEFAHRVFDYYNGRINVFNNKAILYIDFVNVWGSGVVGTSRNPNIVYLYPYVLERYVETAYDFWYNMIVTIIHELHHIDQDINYIRLSKDSKYKEYIEDSVDVSTYLYIANNRKEILEKFGLENEMEANEYIDMLEQNFNMGYLYKRRNYLTHMVSMLRDLIYVDGDHPTIDKFIKIFNDLDSKIYVHINNTEFILKDGVYCMNVNQLNGIMEEEFFHYNLRYAFVEIVTKSISRKEYTMTISTNCSNLMYHLK